MVLRVLSVDIGKVNYTCCAASFAEEPTQGAECKPTTIGGKVYRSIEIIDVFNLNLGQGVQGLKALDILVSVWNDLALFQSWSPDAILIEQQLRDAALNYALSIATYTLAKKTFSDCKVRFVRPLSKFSGYKRFFGAPEVEVCLSTYRQRKDSAVRLSTYLVKTYFGRESLKDYWREEILGSSVIQKLDDSADSFLQVFCL